MIVKSKAERFAESTVARASLTIGEMGGKLTEKHINGASAI